MGRAAETENAPPVSPRLDPRMRRYMKVRAARRFLSEGLSGLVRLAYPGRFDRHRHTVIIPESSLSPWRFDAAFRDMHRKIERFSLVDEMRLYELWQLTGELASVPGDIIEVGVWRGGSGCLIAAQSQRTSSDARIYLCDTFKGVVKAGAEDPIYSGGEHSDTSPELVRSLARHLALANVEILTGIFPEETSSAVEARQFKLCHLDVDVYESTRAAAEWIWPRLVEGGIIVVDDYGGDGMDGVQQAVEEVAGNRACRRIHNLNGHAILVKIGP